LLERVSRAKAYYKNQKEIAYYRVSGGPIMVTLHSKMLISSTKPAEKPSTGFLQRSARKGQSEHRGESTPNRALLLRGDSQKKNGKP